MQIRMGESQNPKGGQLMLAVAVAMCREEYDAFKLPRGCLRGFLGI